MSQLKLATFSENQSLSQSESFISHFLEKNSDLKHLYEKNFLVKFCTTGLLSKFLPSQFGVYIRYLDQPEHSILVIFKKGKCDSYQTPDLTGFKGNQGTDAREVTRFLKTRYGIPIQLIDTTFSDWREVSDSSNPLRALLHHVKSKTIHLTPFRWNVVLWTSLKAFF